MHQLRCFEYVMNLYSEDPNSEQSDIIDREIYENE